MSWLHNTLAVPLSLLKRFHWGSKMEAARTQARAGNVNRGSPGYIWPTQNLAVCAREACFYSCCKNSPSRGLFHFLLKPWALSPPPLYPDQPLPVTYPPVFRAPFKALLDVEMVYGSPCCRLCGLHYAKSWTVEWNLGEGSWRGQCVSLLFNA